MKCVLKLYQLVLGQATGGSFYTGKNNSSGGVAHAFLQRASFAFVFQFSFSLSFSSSFPRPNQEQPRNGLKPARKTQLSVREPLLLVLEPLTVTYPLLSATKLP